MQNNLIKYKRSYLFHKIRKKQPYKTNLLGIDLLIIEDVFPPNIGSSTIYLGEVINKYKNAKAALDMGCGSGVLAFCMRKYGIPIVWAVDIHKPAIKCSKLNLKLNRNLAPITIVESDLFSRIDINIRFDLIVFNHPYYPTVGNPVFGDNPDGGRKILEKFFSSMSKFCNRNTEILVPFSNMSDSKHDPMVVASQFERLRVKTIFSVKDDNGFHKIYEISFKNGF